MDLVVWSNSTLRYEPYTDYAGYVFNDLAMLAVGMTSFVYDEGAVSAIRAQDKAFTAAEAAIRQGSSVPWRLKPPAFVKEALTQQVLLQADSEAPPADEAKHSPKLSRFMDARSDESASLA